MTLVEQFLDTRDGLSEEEYNAISNILDHFINQIGMSPKDFGSESLSIDGLLMELETIPFERLLKKLASSIDRWLEDNPDKKDIYGSYSNNGRYHPFTVQDFYEIDDQSGIFDMPY